MDIVEGSSETFTIAMRLKGQNEYDPKTRTIYINPNADVKMMTQDGVRTISTTRMIAHELGHAAGALDDGKDSMNNVEMWENPVMTPIDGLIRNEY